MLNFCDFIQVYVFITNHHLRGALLGRDRPNHFGLLSLVFILWAVSKSVTCWEEIRRSHLHESPNPMGQLGVVSVQHHRAEVFLEEVSGQGGRTLESTAMCS